MSDTVYFVLQPPDWTGQGEHVRRPLIGHGGAGIPWVSVARGKELVRRGDPEARELVAKARAWIDTNAPTWNVVSTSGALFWKRPSIVRPINARAAGLRTNVMDDLSSELLLSPVALAAAAEQLRSTDLIAAIPKRGWLVLAAGRPGEFPKMLPAHQVADGVFGRAAPEDALTDTVFFVTAGALAGISTLKGDKGALSLTAADETKWTY